MNLIHPPRTAAQAPRHRGIKVAASLVLVALFVWWFKEAGLPLVPSAETWDRLPLLAWLANLGAVCLSHFLRCRRWLHLLRPLAPRLDPRHTLGVGLVGYFAALAAPFRLGEFVRPLLIARAKTVGFLEALGSIVAERVIDGLTITSWAALALLFAPPLSHLPDHLGDVPLPVAAAPRVVQIGPLLFLAALAVMGGLWFSRHAVSALIVRVLGGLSVQVMQLALALVTRLAEGFGALKDGFRLAFVADNLLFWGALIAGHWILLTGVGFEATFAQAAVLVGVQALGSLLPAGPGQFGAFQLSAYVGLVLYFPTEQVLTDGSMVVFLAYLSQIAAHLLGAAVGLWLIRRAPVQLGASEA